MTRLRERYAIEERPWPWLLAYYRDNCYGDPLATSNQATFFNLNFQVLALSCTLSIELLDDRRLEARCRQS